MKVAVFFPKVKSDILAEILSGRYPDKLSSLSSFSKLDMEYQLFDPLPIPLNPMASQHSLYSGIDPLRSLMFALKNKKFDIILSVGESSALCFIWLQKYLKIKLPPIVVWDPALTNEWKNRVKMLNFVLPNVDNVAVLGRNQELFIEENIGKCNTSVLPHWIDCEYFSPSHCVKEDNAPFILAVGDDVSRDYSLLEEAVSGLNIKVIIVSRKFKPKAASNITVISKFLSFAELRQLYFNSLFVVVPLKNVHHAGGINGIQEAMAMQKASIVSGSEGVKDYLTDSTSLIIKPESVSEMRAAIEQLKNTQVLRENLAIDSRKHAVEKYGCDVLATSFKALFNKVLENRS